MEPTNQPLPREAIDAYNLYIHGEIDRRSFFDRVKKVAISGVAAAAIVDQLMPNYAAAQQVSPTDARIRTERATVPSPNGNGSIEGLLVRPVAAGTERALHPGHPRKPRAQPAHRGCRPSPGARELHDVRAGRPDVGRRLSR